MAKNRPDLGTRMEERLKGNWSRCDPLYHQWKPGNYYRFPVKVLRQMARETDPNLLEAVAAAYYEAGQKKFKIADDHRIPYALADYVIKEEGDKREEDRAGPFHFKERLEAVLDKLVGELNRRVHTPSIRAKLSTEELGNITKAVILAQKQVRESELVPDGVTVIFSRRDDES